MLSETIVHVLGDLDYNLEHSTRLYGHEKNMLEIPILGMSKIDRLWPLLAPPREVFGPTGRGPPYTSSRYGITWDVCEI